MHQWTRTDEVRLRARSKALRCTSGDPSQESCAAGQRHAIVQTFSPENRVPKPDKKREWFGSNSRRKAILQFNSTDFTPKLHVVLVTLRHFCEFVLVVVCAGIRESREQLLA
jgi:hypothetical protein